MTCSGCKRRQEGLLNTLNRGFRTTRQVTDRIRRAIGSTEQKHDNIKMTPDGVIKICSLCNEQSDPAATAGQIKPLTCDKCEGQQ